MAGAGIHPFPPPPVPGAPDAAVRPGSDEVRTIFITGLPVDVKERELHNLLRWLPGFEASQINFKGDQPMGFALFSYAHHAIAAKAALQDLVFDAETKSALHIEMAKKNLFIKREWELTSDALRVGIQELCATAVRWKMTLPIICEPT
uniref:RRM domain-containing protein n=1 Tax=Triticum urartu TaxID=4572 RepID=A0A8R7VH37_TRIUA